MTKIFLWHFFFNAILFQITITTNNFMMISSAMPVCDDNIFFFSFSLLSAMNALL